MISWVMSITALEYFIWGIIDPFYGLFVYEVVQDYAIVGLIFGVRTIISIASLIVFQKIFTMYTPLQNLFLVNIFMIIFSLCSFFAGFFTSPILLFTITIFYGIISSLKTISRQNLLRNTIPPQDFTHVMSESISLKYGAWVLGMIFGGIIIMFWEGVPLYWLFVSIAGLWAFSLFPFLPYFNDIKSISIASVFSKDAFSIPYFSLSEYKAHFLKFPFIVRYNFLLFAFSEFLGRVTLLFIPMLGQSMRLSLSEIFWLTAFMVSPMVFTRWFALAFSHVNKLVIIIISIALSFIPLWYLSVTQVPLWIAVCSFIISASLAMLQPALLGISQKYTPSTHIQEATRMEVVWSMLGNVLGAIGIGYIAKFWSMEVAFLVTAIISLFFLLLSIVMKITAPKHTPHDDHQSEEQQEKMIVEHTHFHFRRHFG